MAGVNERASRKVRPDKRNRAGRWFHSIGQVLAAAFVAVHLVFAVQFTCTVTGILYNDLDKGADFKRSDSCLPVKEQMHDDGLLILYTRNWFVLIQLPEYVGHQKFWYRWGSTRAHIADRTLELRVYVIHAA